MGKLKAQTTAATVAPDHAVSLWPEMVLAGESSPTNQFGRTSGTAQRGNQPSVAEQEASLQAWYAALQGALDKRLGAMSAEIENLKAQLKTPAA